MPEAETAKANHGANPAAKTPCWHNFYWVLAALDAAVVTVVLGLNCWAISEWRSTLRFHEQCSNQLTTQAEISKLAGRCRYAACFVADAAYAAEAQREVKSNFAALWMKLDAMRVKDLPQVSSIRSDDLNQAWLRVTVTTRKFEQECLKALAQRERVAQIQDVDLSDLNDAYAQAIAEFDGVHSLVTTASNQLAEQHQQQIANVRVMLWLLGVAGVVVTASVFYLGRRFTRDINRTLDDFAEKEARLSTIIDTAADGVIAMNHQGIIEQCNQATLDLFGLQRSDLLKNPIFAFLEEVNDNVDASGGLSLTLFDINAAIGKKQEYCGTRLDGSKFYVEFAVAEARIGNRRIITGILHDVTERRRFEVELRQASVAAAAATEAKSQFLANMSHEIRTPMTAIIGYADLLLEPGQSADERTRCVETVRRNADHLLTLINDILDISKIEAGKMTVEKIKMSPSQIVGDVASLMRVRALEKKIGFEVIYDSPIPAEITGDPVRVRQILINLVGNAIKFTKSGQVKIHVWSANLGKANPQIFFRVVDSGIGMSTEQLGRLFKPFTQADVSTTRQFGGTGLGLTICLRLVEMMGGKITVSSVPGLGSSFEAQLPTGNLTGVRILENPVEAEFETTGVEARSVYAVRLNARILLAEDGVDNRRLISYHLQKAGATVTPAENGQIAYEKALEAIEKGQPFDVIFMDMAMPVMDGYQATSKLRQQGYHRPVVALTAHAMSSDRDKCISAGCDDYLTKPIDPRKLIEKARQYALIASETNPADNTTAAAANSAPSELDRVLSHIDSTEPQTAPHPAKDSPASNDVDSDDNEDERLISEFADDPDMAEIIEMFLGGLEERVTSLDSAFGTGNLTELASVAHQLKGAAGGYGYPIISSLAFDVEKLAKAGQADDVLRSTLDRLVLMCRRAIAGAPTLATASA